MKAGAARALVARVGRTAPVAAIASLLDRRIEWAPDTFAALTYHRVDEPDARPWLYPALLSATPAGFEAQMKMVQQRFTPIAMDDLLAASRGHARLPARAILVTFDDGYTDFADRAWPTLRRLGVPVTMFVATRYPGREIKAFWWDRLWAALTLDSGAAAATTAGGVDGSKSAARHAHDVIQQHKEMPHAEALASVEAIWAEAGLSEREPDLLDWTDLQRLAVEGVTLAPHSRRHAVLTKVATTELADEIGGSRAELAERLPGQPPSAVFAYPSGAHDSTVAASVAEAGFELAFTTIRGANRLGRTDPLRLRRINVGQRADESLLSTQLALVARWHRIIGR